ncbi:serine/threonine-protein kinase [Streptomyces sp. NPDC093221]|uniref:serine/threonine-protein kinase n=1 Tax=Streptomyces sp. NPDC093221 TaxID=3366032 RepID=UPI0038231869
MLRLEPGDPGTVGPYRTLARIGTGGMATVYLARSRGGRSVAVKVMHADLARELPYRERFRREIAANSAAGGVHSPSVLGTDPDAATPWMATEFLPSLSLRDTVERFGPLPAASVRRLAAGLAEALADLHRNGVAHLDVKPANVLLTADGPRLIDFGIATTAPPAPPGTPPGPGHVSVNASGHAGSWGFMSPEQVAGAAGPPSDVYSLGATLAYAYGSADGGVEDGGGTDALRALVADCRRPDAAARPTAAALVQRLAPAPDESAVPAVHWLPPQVVTAIDANASAADNPPGLSPPSTGPGRRRVLLGGVAAAVVAVAGATAAVLATHSDGSSSGEGPGGDGKSRTTPTRSRAGATPTATAAPTAPTPSAKPVSLVFEVTGTGTLTTVSYAVNGKVTRSRKPQKLPWRRTVEVPGVAGSVGWEIRLTLGSGTAHCRILLDGSAVFDQRAPTKTPFGPTYPTDIAGGGSSSLPGPLPGLDG